MPEAAIHEDSDLGTSEEEIGPTTREPRKGVFYAEAPPARMKEFSQGNLGAGRPASAACSYER